jgi:N-acylneuraminate cytidylyltransferase
MGVISFIPVRGGSKSIPLKNIKPFCGKPLIYWTAKAANDSKDVDRVVIATDSEEIRETVKGFNLPKVVIYDRDPANAKDTSSTESVMLEYIAISSAGDSDIFILLQATSPLTAAMDIDGAMAHYKKSGKDSLLSCVVSKRFFWSGDGKPLNYDYQSRPRRQDFAGVFMENGAIYINTVKNIKDNRNRLNGSIALYQMPDYTGLELDEPRDWIALEMIAREHNLCASVQGIKLFATDVDGVLTDGGMYYSENGDELKRFNTRDAVGLRLLSEAGVTTAVITSEGRALNQRRAEKMRVDYLFQGVSDKLSCASKLCESLNISLSQMAYIGDDINDAALLGSVGLAACPADAVDRVKNIAGVRVLKSAGGRGAVREFAEVVLRGC